MIFRAQFSRLSCSLEGLLSLPEELRTVNLSYVLDSCFDEFRCLVDVQLESPQTVKAVITSDSLKRLELKRDVRVFVVIKATEAMLAKY